MEVHVQFCEESIPRLQPFPTHSEALGARVEFFGTVRGSEDGLPIRGLRYEIYESMAERQIRGILAELEGSHPCAGVAVVHRRGEVRVGEAAVYVGVVASHRREAFGMLSAFMDRLKQEVPIWKTEVLGC